MTTEEVNSLITAAVSPLKGILEVNEEPLVSIDFNRNPASLFLMSLIQK